MPTSLTQTNDTEFGRGQCGVALLSARRFAYPPAHEKDREFPLPALLLLDLKMPKMDGFEVLKWLRQQASFSSLRVVVLTSSHDIRAANVAYQLGANSFLVKPMDFENVVELSKVIQDYWLRRSKAPELSREPKKEEQKPLARDDSYAFLSHGINNEKERTF
jgi:CheY-like chemotaxis protein